MSELELIISEPIGFSQNSTLSICYFKFKAEFFPFNNWEDFTTSILGMWIYQLDKKKHFKTAKYKFYFMDGPYKINVFRKKNNMLIMNFMDLHTQKSKFEVELKYQEFLEILHEGISKFYDSLLLHKDKKELNNLITEIDRLKIEVNHLLCFEKIK